MDGPKVLTPFIKHICARNDGNIIIRSDNGSGGLAEYIVANGGSGSVALKHYGSTKFETTSFPRLIYPSTYEIILNLVFYIISFLLGDQIGPMMCPHQSALQDQVNSWIGQRMIQVLKHFCHCRYLLQ